MSPSIILHIICIYLCMCSLDVLLLCQVNMFMYLFQLINVCKYLFISDLFIYLVIIGLYPYLFPFM
jgi:hypothetical protein